MFAPFAQHTRHWIRLKNRVYYIPGLVTYNQMKLHLHLQMTCLDMCVMTLPGQGKLHTSAT